MMRPDFDDFNGFVVLTHRSDAQKFRFGDFVLIDRYSKMIAYPLGGVTTCVACFRYNQVHMGGLSNPIEP